MRNKIILGVSFLLFFTIGCKKDLVVKNLNEPDFNKVYSSGDDLENITSSLFNSWYNGNHSYSSTYMAMATSADNASCSWGNQAMRDMSWEPRKAWNNAPNYSYQGTTKYVFDKMYSVINTASNILKAVDGGVNVGDNGAKNNLVKAVCKFHQGVGYGTLALVFDRAFIVDEKVSLPDAKPETGSKYKDVAIAALKYLDEAIALTSNTFTIPKTWMGTASDVSNVEFRKIANSMAARIMANMPRNSAELAAVNWAKVKTYSDAGITSNFTIIMDGYNKWYAEAGDYVTFPGWGVVDMRVVNMMDPTMPAHWDDDPNFPAPPKSTNAAADKRLTTDFKYVPSNWLRPERGYYHYSNYRYSRYDNVYDLGTGPIAEMLLAENDMLRAEARLYTNDLVGAALIINAGTRKTRGELPDVLPLADELKKAIHHERNVEMMVTGMGLQFYEMRKRNFLQKGTPLHFPLPAKTLETFGEKLPFYTFGGPGGADGINGSNTGWR